MVVAAREVPLYLWKAGQRVVALDCTYREENTKVAGIVKGVEVAGGETYVHVAPEGTQSEALVKWVGQHPGRVINLHLCPKDCGNLSKDALVHCKGVKQWKHDQKEGWMDNLLGMGGLPPDVDELSRLRRRAEETGGEAPDRGPPRLESDTSEESKAKRRKKKKGKKVKKDKERGKISGTKELAAVIGSQSSQAQDSQEESAPGGKEEEQEGCRHRLLYGNDLRWERQLLRGGGDLVRRRDQGQDGLEEGARGPDIERPGADAKRGCYPNRATVAARPQCHTSDFFPVLEDGASRENVRSHGTRSACRRCALFRTRT